MSNNNYIDELLKLLAMFAFICVSLLAFKCRTIFALDITTSYEVSVKIIIYIATAATLGFFTRDHIEFTTQFLIAIPFAYFWLSPVLDYKAIQTIPEVPFYLSGHGQILGLLLVIIFCFALWVFKETSSNSH
ncbi:hypothetical protein [Acinetobacter seifertii]|uniref:Uncharacterized protein n=1 Tax=Acinetobacter seifertii TaxID=1530123 RepID=A0ABX8L2N5_9GAMM|nr:hypothetical protein [Acinetobacter seifertii]QXB45906.1 hypothetical protein I6L30_16045 [Acinetobacter seifertii]